MNRIPGLDGIRALAALSVVFTHLSIYKTLQDNGILSASVINSINGAAGVQAFFVLSGFLITHLLISEYEKYGNISLYNFYIRRSLRIFPLYFLVLMLVCLAQYFGEQVANSKSILFATFYSYNFIPKAWYSGVLGHTWSLAVEEHFYLVWPFIFISLAPKFRNLARVLATFFIVSFFIALMLSNWQWLNETFFVKRWSFIAGANIAIGALLAMLLSGEDSNCRIKTLSSTSVALFFGVMLIFSEVWLKGTNYFFTQYLRAMGFAVLVGWLFLNQNSFITRSLEIAPLSYLGKISYGIYMYQGFFLSTGPYRATSQTWPPEQNIGLILLIIVAPLSYKYFEKPMLNMKSKLQRSSDSRPNKSMRRFGNVPAD